MKQDQVIAMISKCEECIVYYSIRPTIGPSYAIYDSKQSDAPAYRARIYVPQVYQKEPSRYILNRLQREFAMDSCVIFVHAIKKNGIKNRLFYISNDTFYTHADSKSLDIL